MELQAGLCSLRVKMPGWGIRAVVGSGAVPLAGSECAEAAFPVRSTLFSPQPQSLIDELLLYKRSEDQIELKEKQLSTMRVDVCSTETLKCLKGKDAAGSGDTHVELSGPLGSVEP